MISFNPKPPNTQRSFCSRWSELEYVCAKVHFWLHTRQSKSQAARFAPRLGRILKSLPPSEMAILQEEGKALFHELRGELTEAIMHRQRETGLMLQLQAEADDPCYDAATRKYMLAGRDKKTLKSRQQLLRELQTRLKQSQSTKLTKATS